MGNFGEILIWRFGELSKDECHGIFYHPEHPYIRVCRQLISYQFGYPDNFHMKTIDDDYVDGVSITHGSPRSHI